MKEARFLGALLLHGPLLYPIIEEMKEKYDIPDVEAGRDALKQRLLESVEDDDTVDWEAVRKELEKEIRSIPDLLPPGLADFQKIIQARNTIPPEPTFTEPITDKLKSDVLTLYHAFVKLFFLFSDNLAAPWQTAIDSCFSAIVDNAFELLYTGEIRDIPQDWISAVRVLPLFGDEVVMAMASRLADPDVIAQDFRQKLIDTYGKHRPKLTRKNLPFTKYSAMRLRRIPIKDIADEYIEDHPKAVPGDPESPEYRREKRKLEERLKKCAKAHLKTLDAMVGEEIP
jgi:hypothetical protein